MTTYEKLHSRIVELVPDIKKLEFGCEFTSKYNRNLRMVFTHKTTIPRGRMNAGKKVIGRFDGRKVQFDVDSIEIIGRPITYEDIVVAIKRRCGVPDKERADLMQTAAGASCLAVGNRWQWQKPLEQQDEETLLFISKILEI